MKKLWAAFREWLIEVWDFVPREDYAHVQRERWLSEDHVRALIREQNEILDSMYSRKYKPFEVLADAPVETIRMDHADVQQTEFRWSVKMPHRRFYTTYDLKRELDVMKSYVLERFAQAFKLNLGEQLFGNKKPTDG